MSVDILTRILADKRTQVAAEQQQVPLTELKARVNDLPPPRPFEAALRQRAAHDASAVIAEIKRASPSAGVIRADFDPAAHAASYASGGATALSVLTDQPYFQGHDQHLLQARQACPLPVLRKDFIVDPWQVWQTRAMGADGLLLIVAALDDGALAELSALGEALGLGVLVEVHDQQELDRALAIPGRLLGINNRDLRRFETDLATTERLAPQVPADRLVVAESGLRTPADIERLRRAGVGCFLIGESLMRHTDPGQALQDLLAPSDA
jgi:indole-3-glycerol phosphate synthase